MSWTYSTGQWRQEPNFLLFVLQAMSIAEQEAWFAACDNRKAWDGRKLVRLSCILHSEPSTLLFQWSDGSESTLEESVALYHLNKITEGDEPVFVQA